MGNTNWEEELRKTLNLIPYISNPNVGKGYFEFVLLPNGKDGKKAELKKHKLEKLIKTIEERVSLNTSMQIRVENEEIAGKIKYTVRAIPYGGETEQEKLNLFNNSVNLLCNIIKDYLYVVEHIKKP